MHPITKNNEVLTRYTIEDVRPRQWEGYFSQIPAYKLVRALKSDSGKIHAYKIVYRVPLFKEWLKEKETEGLGFKCIKCMDQGLTKVDRDWCTCDLGSTARKAFTQITNINEK